MLIELIRELIEGGFVGQAVIATLVTATIAYLAVKQLPIPEFLVASWGLIVGWFFRSQAQVMADRRLRKQKPG